MAGVYWLLRNKNRNVTVASIAVWCRIASALTFRKMSEHCYRYNCTKLQRHTVRAVMTTAKVLATAQTDQNPSRSQSAHKGYLRCYNVVDKSHPMYIAH